LARSRRPGAAQVTASGHCRCHSARSRGVDDALADARDEAVDGVGAALADHVVDDRLGRRGGFSRLVVKNLLNVLADVVSIGIYIASGIIAWPETMAMMVGALIGGFVGGRSMRFLPADRGRWWSERAQVSPSCSHGGIGLRILEHSLVRAAR
jgi:hypothetical protein